MLNDSTINYLFYLIDYNIYKKHDKHDVNLIKVTQLLKNVFQEMQKVFEGES